MVEFENPVGQKVFLRFVGPLFPVWMVGAALILFLDRLSVEGHPLGPLDLAVLLVVYSLLMGGLVSLLYYHEWGHSPSRMELSSAGVAGHFEGSQRRDREFDYERILRILPEGYFTPRVEARSIGGTSIDWMNLTEENALRLAEAWAAWRERDPRTAGAA